MKLKTFAPWNKSYHQSRQHIKEQSQYFTDKGLSGQSYGFFSSHAWMRELYYKEIWIWRNDAFELWCWRRPECPLDSKEIKPINAKGNQSWIFIGRADAEAEASVFWPPDVKNWLIGKGPDAAKDWWQEEKGMTEDETVGWHHRLNDVGLSKLLDLVMDKEAWYAAGHQVTKSWTGLNDWTELMMIIRIFFLFFYSLGVVPSVNYGSFNQWWVLWN